MSYRGGGGHPALGSLAAQAGDCVVVGRDGPTSSGLRIRMVRVGGTVEGRGGGHQIFGLFIDIQLN